MTTKEDNCNHQVQIPSILDATSKNLLTGFAQLHFNSRDLVNAYFKRIKEINSTLNVVMELNPDALSIAAELDEERLAGRLRGPLHGLPILIKGNIGTRDSMQTNDPAGSLALVDAVLPTDSTIATKLRAQGLIILGKASLGEWSMLRSDNSTPSWNPISGQAYSGYYPKLCPGGSSGGSAVAADLGLAWAALGTETSGSITSPSDRNNVVGIKPTVGLTSRHLIVPASEHQDTVGPIARTVKDAAILLSTIAGPDPNDPYTLTCPFNYVPNYQASCKLDGLRRKRIGIARNVIDAELDLVSHMLPAFENAIALMARAGATIVDNADFKAYTDWKRRPFNPVTRADFVTNLAHYLARLEYNPYDIYTVHHLQQFTQRCPAEEYPQRNTASWDVAIEQNLGNTSPEFTQHYRENMYLGGEGGVLGALERYHLDAIVLPTKVAYEIPALVGSPIITVPLGAAGSDVPVTKIKGWDEIDLAPGVPFGISFLGKKWSEEVLIEIAYAFEQISQVRGTVKRWCQPQSELKDEVIASYLTRPSSPGVV
ncbi:amidase signature enzyme [Periconia macrospinosa]|uniref:Amidase signature enzyme n=1 Tax=Periconia macrospinosa TaxID=97972 RepID=A0A2V1DWG4_9PLEO|nr:amidase signature enzyme [Periconia macrospinosa]